MTVISKRSDLIRNIKVFHMVLLFQFCFTQTSTNIIQAKFRLIKSQKHHTLKSTFTCGLKCLRKKHCHSFRIDPNSVCTTTWKGCRRSLAPTCYLKITRCEGQRHYSPWCKQVYYIVDDEKEVLFRVTDTNVQRIKWKKGRKCNIWWMNTFYLDFYWLCDDGVKLGVGKYIKSVMRIKKYLFFPEDNNRWFEVDGTIIFAQKWQYSRFTYKYHMSAGKISLESKLKIPESKVFFLDRMKKHIYWLNKHLRRVDYKGKRPKQFKNIRAKSFFMEFLGPVPTVYGYNKKITKWKVGGGKGKVIGTSPPIFAECEGIWHVGDRTLVTLDSEREGFLHVERKTIVWKKVHTTNSCVFVAFVGWW